MYIRSILGVVPGAVGSWGQAGQALLHLGALPLCSATRCSHCSLFSLLSAHCSLCSTTRNSIVLRTGRVIHRLGVSGPACLWWSDTRCLRSTIAQTRQSLGGRLVKYRILWPSRLETYIPLKHMNIPQTLNQNVQISFHIMNCPTRWYIKSWPNQIGADHFDVWRKWFCPKYSEILKS